MHVKDNLITNVYLLWFLKVMKQTEFGCICSIGWSFPFFQKPKYRPWKLIFQIQALFYYVQISNEIFALPFIRQDIIYSQNNAITLTQSLFLNYFSLILVEQVSIILHK